MSPKETEQLCLSLIETTDSHKVYELLKEYDLWDKKEIWRPYGDVEGNWSTINSHGATDYCLNEKIINSIDSTLTNECWLSGTDPKDQENAPKNILDAVHKYLGDPSITDGSKKSHIFWSQQHRLKIARRIFVSCGGLQGNPPTISIADLGEGQVPEMVPKTFLSLLSSNKIGIDFVQGKWNQGGSGAMKYCGQGSPYQFQLIVTKRNPDIIKKFPEHESNNTARKDDWSFTVIKRVLPTGKIKRSDASYLAPIGPLIKDNRGEVLSFRNGRGLPFFPNEYDQCSGKANYGSLIKLYNYSIKSGDAMRTGGLMFNLGWLLPRSPIPVRFHDARKGFKRNKGSFQYNIEGVSNFLERTSLTKESSNLEKLDPSTDFIKVKNYKIEYDIFVFKKDQALQFKGRQGVIWTINGQAHATQPDIFFKADDLGYASIADHMLVVLKCDNISVGDREDIFASTRDKIDHGHSLVKEIKKRLVSQLKEHTGIQEIVTKRILEDTKKPPVQDKRLLRQLQEIISETPLIESLDLGDLLKNKTKVEKKLGDLKKNLKEFPTIFHFKGTKGNKEILERDSFIGRDVRLTLVTDAKNNYFTRRKDRGELDFFWDDDGELKDIENTGGPFLRNGICKVTLKLKHDLTAGDDQKVKIIIKDKKTTFECLAELNIREKPVTEKKERKRKESKRKNKNEEGVELEDEDKHDLIIALPLTELEWKEKWGKNSWSKFEVLKVVPYTDPKTQKSRYIFYYNKDYQYLLQEQIKATPSNPAELIERKFQIALSLFGMSALSTYKFDKKSNRKGVYDVDNPFATDQDSKDENQITIQETRVVEIAARTIAMLILPTIKVVNKLSAKVKTTTSEILDEN
jgi:hypothetical protein|tara:strand:- start:122 stop:2692 length:2571 start_codon:yes stop_codon:yes gene_type:complete